MILESGDVLICRGHSWISRGIMLITKGQWSHAAIVAETWEQQGVIEAQKNGVNFKLWDVWQSKWGYTFEAFRSVETFDKKELMLKAFEKCGETKYDWFTFFRRIFGSRKQRDTNKENKRYICSEFVAYVWNIQDGYDITPEELYKYLINNKQWKKIKH
jgi:hypothetical protein